MVEQIGGNKSLFVCFICGYRCNCKCPHLTHGRKEQRAPFNLYPDHVQEIYIFPVPAAALLSWSQWPGG